MISNCEGWRLSNPDILLVSVPSDIELSIIKVYLELDKSVREKMIEHFLSALPEIQDAAKSFSKDSSEHLKPVAAHERTDIEVTDEMKKHDDDLMGDDSNWEN